MKNETTRSETTVDRKNRWNRIPDHAEKDDDKASTCGVSSLHFIFLDDYKVGTEKLEPPSAFMNLRRNLPESSSPGKLKTTAMILLMKSA